MSAGIATEIGWIGAHLTRYPIGLVSRPRDAGSGRTGSTTPYGLAGLSALQRGLLHSNAGLDAATTPIVLVHGIGDNHTIFSTLGRSLARRGFTSVWTFDYGLFTVDVRATARRLAEAVERLAARTGATHVHLVGHSLGGLVARYYAQRLAPSVSIATVVTLGTPHQGTRTAQLLGLPLVRQLRPDSPLLRELAEPATGVRTRFVAFATDLDHLIVPGWRARIEHPDLDVTNLEVHGVGHMSLTNNRRIVRQIAGLLAEEPVSHRKRR